jgi:long-subunit acyl-CoA synthetase (AMP-forming)
MDDLRRARPTVFVSVPRIWLKFQLGVFEKIAPPRLDLLLRIPLLSRLVAHRILVGLGLDATRLATSGSAPLPREVLQWYRRLGLELNEGYGMTEDFAYSHAGLPGQGRPGYVGRPFPGVEVRLGEDGEVLVRSPAAMLGYYKDPQLTAACRTPDGYFRTGDLGERDEKGNLRITGRVKDLFKTSKGKYVAPVPIENRLDAEPVVELSCIVGAGLAQPIGLVVLAEERRRRRDEPATRGAVTAELSALLDRVNRKLMGHERLAHLVVVKDEWQVANALLTPTLKIRRAAIEAAYAARLPEWYERREKVIWEN